MFRKASLVCLIIGSICTASDAAAPTSIAKLTAEFYRTSRLPLVFVGHVAHRIQQPGPCAIVIPTPIEFVIDQVLEGVLAGNTVTIQFPLCLSVPASLDSNGPVIVFAEYDDRNWGSRAEHVFAATPENVERAETSVRRHLRQVLSRFLLAHKSESAIAFVGTVTSIPSSSEAKTCGPSKPMAVRFRKDQKVYGELMGIDAHVSFSTCIDPLPHAPIRLGLQVIVVGAQSGQAIVGGYVTPMVTSDVRLLLLPTPKMKQFVVDALHAGSDRQSR